MSFLDTLMNLVHKGEVVAADGAVLVKAAIQAYHDVENGNAASALESIQKNFPAVLPVLESVANLIVPGSGTAIELAAHLLAFSHKMTSEEEQRWFDRASGSGTGS